jgi:hypothetical protein
MAAEHISVTPSTAAANTLAPNSSAARDSHAVWTSNLAAVRAGRGNARTLFRIDGAGLKRGARKRGAAS